MRNNQKPVKKRVFVALFIFFLLILGLFVIKGGKYFPALWQLIFQKEIQLKTSKDERVNVLLLGIAGGMHDGPGLTDTIIFASIDPSEKRATLVSIPRDLWMPELMQKINFAYPDGESKKEGGGIIAAEIAVEKLLGQDIDYVFRIDFDGFVKAVDEIGGIDVIVENTLEDQKYPITGNESDPCGLSEDEIASLSAEIASGSASENEAFPCRYERIYFEKGKHKMTGEEALKFVRSRNGINGEGSDFARSKRQEKVIEAFKDKIFSLDTFLNPVKIVNLAKVLEKSIDTNIKEDEYDDFIKLANKLENIKIKSVVLDIGNEADERFGLLEQPQITEKFNYQYVLIPRIGNGDYSEIQEFVACEIKYGNCAVVEKGITTPNPTKINTR